MVPVAGLVNFIAAFLFLGFWLFSFVVLYHLTRFGVGVLPKKLSVVFLIGAVSLFSWSIVCFVGLDLNAIKL